MLAGLRFTHDQKWLKIIVRQNKRSYTYKKVVGRGVFRDVYSGVLPRFGRCINSSCGAADTKSTESRDGVLKMDFKDTVSVNLTGHCLSDQQSKDPTSINRYRSFASEVYTIPNAITISRCLAAPYLGWLIHTVKELQLTFPLPHKK